METVKFKKPGQKIVFTGKGPVKEITEATLTTDIARELIANNPNYEKLFVFENEPETAKVKTLKPSKEEK